MNYALLMGNDVDFGHATDDDRSAEVLVNWRICGNISSWIQLNQKQMYIFDRPPHDLSNEPKITQINIA